MSGSPLPRGRLGNLRTVEENASDPICACLQVHKSSDVDLGWPAITVDGALPRETNEHGGLDVMDSAVSDNVKLDPADRGTSVDDMIVGVTPGDPNGTGSDDFALATAVATGMFLRTTTVSASTTGNASTTTAASLDAAGSVDKTSPGNDSASGVPVYTVPLNQDFLSAAQKVTMGSASFVGGAAAGAPAAAGTANGAATAGGSPALATLVNFGGPIGTEPYGGLMADALGNLYGVTTQGGENGFGTVFQIPFVNGSYGAPIILGNFSGGYPWGGLTIGPDGSTIYGTTQAGGADGLGSVFKLTRIGDNYTMSTVVSFTGANGANPADGVTIGPDGSIYVTALAGGTNGDGVVDKIPDVNGILASTPEVITDFDGANGEDPEGSLRIGSYGTTIYGTTSAGGANNQGTIFQLTDIGNNFMIRHTEVTKPPITESIHVDYLFHRLFSFIRMLLQANGVRM